MTNKMKDKLTFEVGKSYQIRNSSEYTIQTNGEFIDILIEEITTDPDGYLITDLSGRYAGLSHWEPKEQYERNHSITHER